MMRPPLDLTGQVFGKLTAVQIDRSSEKRGTRWLCRCECGGSVVALAANLKRGNTRSCGCLHAEVSREQAKHGLEGTKVYRAWQHMKARCYNPNKQHFDRYGGRGVEVCERWRDSFEAFLADVGHPPSPQHSLDRWPDRDGHYKPGNVRWANSQVQSNNRASNRHLTHDGRSLTIAEWARETGVPPSVIAARVQRLGWSVERALTTPARVRSDADGVRQSG